MCTVIKIENLLPKRLRGADIEYIGKFGFLMLSVVNGRMLVVQNIGQQIPDIEIRNIGEFVKKWGGGETINFSNGVLEMELPSFLIPFHDEINSIPGCRFSPNILRVDGDVYITIEFHRSSRIKVGESVLNFLGSEHLFRKELVYHGNRNNDLPFILQLYSKSEKGLEDLFVIQTVWNLENEDLRLQNNGIFQNRGTFIPKSYSNSEYDHLIFKADSDKLLGDGLAEIVDRKENLFEVRIKSKWFTDFYNEIIRRYSGPVFATMTVTEKDLATTYVIERAQQSQFLTGLKNFWMKPARVSHRNYIMSAFSLKDIYLKSNNAI